MGVKRFREFKKRSAPTGDSRVLLNDEVIDESFTVPSSSLGGGGDTSESIYADTYDATGGTDVTNGAVVQLDTVRASSGADFSLSNGVLAYNSASKLFFIVSHVSTDTGGGRDNSRFWLERSTDGGTSWSKIQGTEGWMYNRTGSNGESTGASSCILSLSSSDKLRLFSEGVNASGPVTTIASASGLTAFGI